MRPLAKAASEAVQPMIGKETGLVFPASRGAAYDWLSKFWERIAKLGGLPDEVTPHVFRHSFASLAADLGYSEPTIAALIGQRVGRSQVDTSTAPMLCCSLRPTRWPIARLS